MESVFGVEFGDAAVLFQITLWMLLFYGIVLVLATFLIASRNQRIDLRVNVNSTVLSLILHFVLIRVWSGLGAAIALLLSIAVFFLQQDYSVRRILFPVPYFHLAWKILLAAILMGAGLILLSPVPLGFRILSGILIYGAGLVLLGGVSFREIRSFRNLGINRR